MNRNHEFELPFDEKQVTRLFGKEHAQVIKYLHIYLSLKRKAEEPVYDSTKPISEGREYIHAAIHYIEAMRAHDLGCHASRSSPAPGKNGLEWRIDELKKEARETIMKSIPYHINRLSQEFPDIMNGQAKEIIPSSQIGQQETAPASKS